MAKYVLVLVLLLSAGTSSVAQTTCTVNSNYLEAIDENQRSLLNVFGMVNAPASPVADPETAGTYFMMLISIRHYHEDQSDLLPDCAQSVNDAYLRTISASQDVITLLIARSALPDDVSRFNRRIRDAQTYLADTWLKFSEVHSETQLEPADR